MLFCVTHHSDQKSWDGNIGGVSLLSDILKNLSRKKDIHYVGDKLWSMNASKIVGAGGGARGMSVVLATGVSFNFFYDLSASKKKQEG